jgi:hypothetical protein
MKFNAKEEGKEKRKVRSISETEKRDGVAVPRDFISNGSKNGIKRLQCKLCTSSLNFDKWE